ncbi:MAG: hypothetical protein ACE37J_17740 [Pikeienuella sp.]|uniref:hypothetical protein n=1 Tax=Pikeienuella sp. TaxID=2831957 RepID=UPI00391DB385
MAKEMTKAKANLPEAGDAAMPEPRPGPRALRAEAAGQGQAGALARRAGPPRRQRLRAEARFRTRHWLLLVSFFVLVVGPTVYANWYLHTRAADQYASRLAFTIQSDDGPTLSSLGQIFGGTATGAADDAEILYGFIQSQNLVEKLEYELGLRERFNRVMETDWFFALGDDPSIEALTDYWKSMVIVSFSAGIVEVEVRSFEPHDSQEIALAVLAESTDLINRLSAEAREDAVRDARLFLDESAERLREVRLAIAALRAAEQRVDPSLDVQALMKRIGELEATLTEEQLRLDQLRQFAADDDSRVVTTERRIASLESAVASERAKLASGGDGPTLSTAVGRFEELTVDRELAEQAYSVALASFENAKAEARRQQRYLSAHVSPTLSEKPEYPQRYLLGALTGLFLFMGWVVLVMIGYNVKDRR